jgi:hypothetical protein
LKWNEPIARASFASGSALNEIARFENVKMGNMHLKHYELLLAAMQIKELRLSNYAKRSYN